MDRKSWRVCLAVALFGLVVLSGTWAEDVKPTDEGKAEAFKGKTFDLKEKGEAALTLTFPGGKNATVTVKSDKKTDVNLFVYDVAKKLLVKDDSPGPNCEVSFTPTAAVKLTLVLRNLGPGDNRSTLKVNVSK
ncbi:MAG: hypothetical protein HYS12_07520 [Planctomycetes bacterium]|nr:hypothetical protein [Planctomycetota bacterium]